MQNHVAGIIVSSTGWRSLADGGTGRAARARWTGWLALLMVGGLATGALGAEKAAADNFMPLVKLAPLVVNGEQLSISVHARSKRDRRYAEGFAEEVIKVVYEGVTDSTGKGLVIIGAKNEPHPIFVFRKFLRLAKEGKLDPAIAARGPELSAALSRWQHTLDHEESLEKEEDGSKVDLEFEKIITALPLPLEGVGAKLYQLAWTEKFDDLKVEARLRTLRAGDLERRDLFARFDWVFYLPPKGAFDQVLDELIAEALKEDDVGFFARTAVKGVMLVVKPKIRQAIEALRHGVMFMTVVQARTRAGREDVEALTAAYVEALMPGKKTVGESEHERAVHAIREQQRRNVDRAKERTAEVPVPDETPTSLAGERTSAEGGDQ